jgi:hypothetical protein
LGNLSYKSRVISSKTTASFSDVEFLAKPIGEVARRAPDKFNLPVLINHSQSSAKEANSEIKLYRQVFAILNGSPVECLRMDVEIDQSGKVEQTDRPTAIALANGIRFSILISAQAKTEVFDELAV